MTVTKDLSEDIYCNDKKEKMENLWNTEHFSIEVFYKMLTSVMVLLSQIVMEKLKRVSRLILRHSVILVT